MPDIRGRELAVWSANLRELARCPNVTCKVSGLVTEARWNAWKPDDFTRYLDRALDAFGPERLMFGSDWPVCLLAADDYRAVYELVEGWAAKLGEERSANRSRSPASAYSQTSRPRRFATRR